MTVVIKGTDKRGLNPTLLSMLFTAAHEPHKKPALSKAGFYSLGT